MAVAVAVVASACSGGDEPVLVVPSTAEVVTVTGGEQTPSADFVATGDAVPLWNAVLAVLEAGPGEERDQAAATAPAGVPVDAVLLVAAEHLPEPVDLTSRAVFDELPDGSIRITDCADASGPTALGATTAGLSAAVTVGPGGEPVLSDLAVHPNCVRREDGQAALDRYQLFLDALIELRRDPRVDHPAATAHRTAAAGDRTREWLAGLERNGLLDDRRWNLVPVAEHVEIVGYRPGQITLRVCTHGDETYGTFDGTGRRVDDLVAPWQVESEMVMLEVAGEWLFEVVADRRVGECSLAPSDRSLQLL